MWMFTKIGFFSVVVEGKEGEQDLLSIRARVRKDLVALKEKYLPNASEIVEIPGRDYPYRVWAWKDDFARAAMDLALGIDYSNFKSEVTRVQGWERHDLYSRVWGVMNGAESKLKTSGEEKKRRDAAWNNQGSLWNGTGKGKGKGKKGKKNGRAYTTDGSGALIPLDSLREPFEQITGVVEVADVIPIDAAGMPEPLASDDGPDDEMESLPVWPEKPLSEKTVGSMSGVPCPWCGGEIVDLSEFTEAASGTLKLGSKIECDRCGSPCEVASVQPSKAGVTQVTLTPAVVDEARH